VGVASNFLQTADRICRAYFTGRPGRCVLTPGASGLLASQIAQGAPFDVFLSGDLRRAQRLEVEGLAVLGSRRTYAIGRLVLWVPGRAGNGGLREALAGEGISTLAIAKPLAAPYGEAALETLRALGVRTEGRYRIVQAESVAQAFQFVASGAADAGFVAYAQVLQYEAATGRSVAHEVVHVDPGLHQPIEQQAVLLASAAANDEARALLEFLGSDPARRIIAESGYLLP
jgi:molybdate transport system substrate-binding protein